MTPNRSPIVCQSENEYKPYSKKHKTNCGAIQACLWMVQSSPHSHDVHVFSHCLHLFFSLDLTCFRLRDFAFFTWVTCTSPTVMRLTHTPSAGKHLNLRRQTAAFDFRPFALSGFYSLSLSFQNLVMPTSSLVHQCFSGQAHESVPVLFQILPFCVAALVHLPSLFFPRMESMFFPWARKIPGAFRKYSRFLPVVAFSVPTEVQLCRFFQQPKAVGQINPVHIIHFVLTL